MWRVWWDDQDGQERDDRSQAEGTQEGNVQVLFPILWQGDKILKRRWFFWFLEDFGSTFSMFSNRSVWFYQISSVYLFEVYILQTLSTLQYFVLFCDLAILANFVSLVLVLLTIAIANYLIHNIFSLLSEKTRRRNMKREFIGAEGGLSAGDCGCNCEVFHLFKWWDKFSPQGSWWEHLLGSLPVTLAHLPQTIIQDDGDVKLVMWQHWHLQLWTWNDLAKPSQSVKLYVAWWHIFSVQVWLWYISWLSYFFWFWLHWLARGCSAYVFFGMIWFKLLKMYDDHHSRCGLMSKKIGTLHAIFCFLFVLPNCALYLLLYKNSTWKYMYKL